MALRHCYKDVVPFSAMVAVEFTIVGLNILFKLASLTGLSYYVFVAYTYVLANLVLLPLAYINFRRATGLPSFKWSFLNRIFLLGLLGFLCQLCSYKGIEYSSPTLASAIGNLIPTFTFILAVIFSHFIANELGLGGPPTTAAHLLVSICYVIQTQVIKSYPAELIVVFLCNLCGIIVSVPTCLLAEPSMSAWKLRPDISLVAILYSGSFSSTFVSIIYTWGMHVKGPVYITSFKPLSIAIAAAMSVIFLGDDLHLGSVVGAVILSTGFYAVIRGKAKEEEDHLNEDYGFGTLGSSSNAKTPLLPSCKT
ncbi:WAT1-related protein [Quillaja saponaria]|uniref:WAT1-related protein n=1 Tax=Quillaja saponaria TaxID=32244 RepID=A0AAD7Q464_QUISA|nr:WAT1-related protein [Quillaja saponaria]